MLKQRVPPTTSTGHRLKTLFIQLDPFDEWGLKKHSLHLNNVHVNSQKRVIKHFPTERVFVHATKKLEVTLHKHFWNSLFTGVGPRWLTTSLEQNKEKVFCPTQNDVDGGRTWRPWPKKTRNSPISARLLTTLLQLLPCSFFNN